MATKFVGYITNYEIIHRSEMESRTKKREAYFARYGQDADKRRAPRLPKMEQWQKSNWYFMKTNMNNRFTNKQFIMMFYQYGTRSLTFDWLINKFKFAIERIPMIKDQISDGNYSDKKSLLQCLIWLFDNLGKDHMLQCIGNPSTPAVPLIVHIRAEVKRVVLDLIKHCKPDGESMEGIDYDVDEVILIWERGCNGEHAGSTVRNAKIFDYLWELLDTVAGPAIEIANHGATSGPIIDQSDHLLCWLKWREYLGTKNKRPMPLIEPLYEACDAFARCAFGHLASMTSIFVLERNRF